MAGQSAVANFAAYPGHSTGSVAFSGLLALCLKAVWQTNIPKPFQDFYSHFNEQSDPKRLFGFSKRGTKHYATPGAGQA